MSIFLFQGLKITGPYTKPQLHQMLRKGTIDNQVSAAWEGDRNWVPLELILDGRVLPPAPSVKPPEAERVVQTNVQQGALLGGTVCFALGIGMMFFSLFTFIFYVPLFFVSFILSIVAMAQRRVFGGIMLLLAAIIVPPCLFFGLGAYRTYELAQHLSHEQHQKDVQDEQASKTDPRFAPPANANFDKSTPTPAPQAPAVEAPAAIPPVVMVLHAKDDCWIRVVRGDNGPGRVVSEGVMHAGENQTFSGNKFTVKLADPSAMTVTYDGKAVALSGYKTPQNYVLPDAANVAPSPRVFDLNNLDAEDTPKKVSLKDPVKVDITGGSIEIPAGTQLGVISAANGTVTVKVEGGTKELPLDETSFEADAKALFDTHNGTNP